MTPSDFIRLAYFKHSKDGVHRLMALVEKVGIKYDIPAGRPELSLPI
jgi:hypothetical protein